MSVNEFKIELSNELICNVKNKKLLEQLILNGADLNYKNSEGWCVLFEAISLGLDKIVSFLLQKGADVNIRDKRGRNALFWVIYYENTTILNTLISFGLDLKKDVYPKLPAIHYAAYKNNIIILKTFLDLGFDIDKKCSNTNSTPLIYAYLYKRKEAIKFLEVNGADMLYTDDMGNTPSNLSIKE